MGERAMSSQPRALPVPAARTVVRYFDAGLEIDQFATAVTLGKGERRRFLVGLLRQLLYGPVLQPRLDAPGLFRDNAVENRAGCDRIREKISEFMSDRPCPSCGGKRLNPSALAVTVE